MPNGTLKLVFRTGNSALPVENVSYTLKDSSGAIIRTGFVGAGTSGISEIISLPAPETALSLTPDSAELPYSLYTVEAQAIPYYDIIVQGLQIFPQVLSEQVVEFLPLPLSKLPRVEAIVYPIGPHALRQTYESEQESFTGRILERVIVPEFITVHLGTPTSSATNVTVPFIDYIKNVASSEIYPTWPEESLRANILAQISLALNRVYTEWYPSRGYTYNITNSTAYDQYFVYGRNIYESVSVLTDALFNTYIRKPGREEPFYAEYCNGTTVSCPGMSQWGTVSLAQNGSSAEEILEFYYGEVDLVTTDNIENIPESYPGSPLRLGSQGDAVATLQLQLDRIAINYPAIPLVFVDGVFGASTEESVRAFQRIASLTQDGIVGRSTWYAVSYYYVAVKKLAELTSEGELPVYNDFAYPGLLRRGSRGTSVQEVQFFLRNLAVYNPAIPDVQIDGVFGASTERAIIAFQDFYNEVPDGVVGPNTWSLLTDEYRGTREVPVPNEPIVTREYPGTLVRFGSTGENVTYVQRLLNYIGDIFVQIPTLTVDGNFGSRTQNAVLVFQRIFGLSQDGIVGAATWSRLNEIYIAAADGCIFESDTASYTRPYPGTLLRQGSTGTNVTYLQNALNKIRTVLRVIPVLSADGIFGAATRNAVVLFQGIFGLSQDGIVGPSTWGTLNYLYVATTDGCLYSVIRDANETVPALSGAVQGDGFRALSLGSFGTDVLVFKRLLAKKTGTQMSTLGENFLFGLATKRSLELFQASEKLPVTGALDSMTLKKLLS